MISDSTLYKAVFQASEMMQGLGYTGKNGSIHLMNLGLQTNAITSIFHNLIAWQIARIGHGWKFHPKGGGTPDLTHIDGASIQVKTTSDNKIKSNRITKHDGFYLCVKYRREGFEIWIKQILSGFLNDSDWSKSQKTQFAFLTEEGEKKLKKIFTAEYLA